MVYELHMNQPSKSESNMNHACNTHTFNEQEHSHLVFVCLMSVATRKHPCASCVLPEQTPEAGVLACRVDSLSPCCCWLVLLPSHCLCNLLNPASATCVLQKQAPEAGVLECPGHGATPCCSCSSNLSRSNCNLQQQHQLLQPL